MSSVCVVDKGKCESANESVVVKEFAGIVVHGEDAMQSPGKSRLGLDALGSHKIAWNKSRDRFFVPIERGDYGARRSAPPSGRCHPRTQAPGATQKKKRSALQTDRSVRISNRESIWLGGTQDVGDLHTVSAHVPHSSLNNATSSTDLEWRYGTDHASCGPFSHPR